MRIFTHQMVDLDAVASLWHVLNFIPGAKHAELVFRPSNWDGSGMEDGDLALDMPAGGRGIKGEREQNGTTHSCFATLVAKYCNKLDRRALRSLVTYVDAQDVSGNAVKYLAPKLPRDVANILFHTGPNSTLRGLQFMRPNDDQWVCGQMFLTLGALYTGQKMYVLAGEEARATKRLFGGRVAIIYNAESPMTAGALHGLGVQAVIYVDGNNLGVLRNPCSSVRVDHRSIRAVVKAAGEQIGDGDGLWFAHSAGFLFCRGSNTAPAITRSKVDPVVLAEAVAELFENNTPREQGGNGRKR